MVLLAHVIFVILLFHLDRGADASSCYTSNGSPIFCEPSTENLAQQKPTYADSTCGKKGPENVCTKWSSQSGHLKEVCEICDDTVTKLKHSSNLSTDDHVRGKETCWLSEALQLNDETKKVNLTIDLQKRSIISYMTLELCGETPDGIIIYKKRYDDDQLIPWQYFSNNCKETFNVEEMAPMSNNIMTYTNRLNAYCFNLDKSIEYGSDDEAFRLIPFNPTLGRNFQQSITNEEQDWLTASQVQFSFVSAPKATVGNYLSQTIEDGSIHIGVANIVIGGRPLCNGHSNAIVSDNNGVPRCECLHNTAGVDCERCDDGHNDQPWTPATFNKPSSCKKCECNNHSKKCKFDISIYIKSNRKHGSKCLECKDNTMGTQCDKCSVGYYRDFKFPMYHKNACASCNCHSIGSYSDQACDAMTGKCFCKPGVIGRSCNQCADGYRQTPSKDIPCKKVIVAASFRTLMKTVGHQKCQFCKQQTKNINFKRYCHKEINLKVSLKSQENRGNWILFHLAIENMWLHKNIGEKLSIDDNQTIKVWLRKELIDCKCVSLKFNRSYILMTRMKTKSFMGNEELMISQKSIVEEWKDEWTNEFDRFKNLQSNGQCLRLTRRKRNARKRSLAYSMDQYANFSQ